MCTRFRTDTAQCQVTCPSGHLGISAQLSCWTEQVGKPRSVPRSCFPCGLLWGGGGVYPVSLTRRGRGGAGRKDRHAGPEARPGTQRTVLEAAPASVGRMCREGSFSSNLGTKPVASTQLQALTRTRCPARGGLRWASRDCRLLWETSTAHRLTTPISPLKCLRFHELPGAERRPSTSRCMARAHL